MHAFGGPRCSAGNCDDPFTALGSPVCAPAVHLEDCIRTLLLATRDVDKAAAMMSVQPCQAPPQTAEEGGAVFRVRGGGVVQPLAQPRPHVLDGIHVGQSSGVR